MVKSFHGRTLATLTATGQDKVKTGFAPLMPGFHYVPYMISRGWLQPSMTVPVP